eukprot:1187427-Prorocentrum_minimum.AAC.2
MAMRAGLTQKRPSAASRSDALSCPTMSATGSSGDTTWLTVKTPYTNFVTRSDCAPLSAWKRKEWRGLG